MTLNRRFAIALGLTALLGAAVVSAEQLGTANVPFTFELAGQKWAPGPYTTVRQNAAGTLLIENSQTGEAAFVMTMGTVPSHSDISWMTFKCYRGQCFLSSIQFSQTRTTYELAPSRREKELTKIDRPQINLVAMRNHTRGAEDGGPVRLQSDRPSPERGRTLLVRSTAATARLQPVGPAPDRHIPPRPHRPPQRHWLLPWWMDPLIASALT
jgi:hypothetical protein